MKKPSLTFWCDIIPGITAVTAFTQILGMINRFYELGKDDTDFLRYQIMVEGIQAWGIIACCVLFFMLAKNVKKAKVFVAENEKLLMIFGTIVLWIGVIAAVLIEIFSVNKLTKSTTTMLIISGFSFILFSLILKIGRKLQEEQELTI